MASTFSALHVHLVFSTKSREPWIAPAIEQRLWQYVAAVAEKNGMVPVQIGGVEDHIHVLVGYPPAESVSRAVQLLKGASSRWVHATFPELESFAWQDGYAAFSVSQSALPAVAAYIRHQRQHHGEQTYANELRALLRKHGIDSEEEGSAG